MPERAPSDETAHRFGGGGHHSRGNGVLAAFTLIELLVVVAIIALLVSILLPSLGKARSQARATLCGTRIAQVTKGMLLYADDFSETPPFIDHGFDRPDPNEAWLAEPNQMQVVLNHSNGEEDWNAAGVRLPDSGVLFPYTRFPDLYRCPEFTRLNYSQMKHHRFNYTRSIGGRRWRAPPPRENGNHPAFGDFRGPILKPSTVYAPGALVMMVDEQWNRHVAADYQYNSNPDADKPMRADPVTFLYDEVGQYHGQKVKEREEFVGLYQQGGMSFWDGHTEFRRDPCPSKDPQGRNILEIAPFMSYLESQLYAQRGVVMTDYLP